MKLIRRISKAIGAALGGLVGTQVDWFTNQLFSFDLPTDVDVAIAVLVAFLGGYLAPKNRVKNQPDVVTET